MAKEKSCAERWVEHYDSRMEDLRALTRRAQKGSERAIQELSEYGLAWEWIPQEGNRAGYYRWQLSWGGPSDEFRFYPSVDLSHDIEYWFMDWYDGHGELIDSRPDLDVLGWIFDYSGVGELLGREY